MKLGPLLFAAVVAAACASSPARNDAQTACTSSARDAEKSTFHGSRARLGWDDAEPALSPARVGGGMKVAWTSAPFARAKVGGVDYAGRAYASPLYADGVRIAKGAATGEALSVVFVATSNGDVIAIAAADVACAEGALSAGTVLWQTRFGTPGVPPRLDSGAAEPPAYPGIAVGVLATPVFDHARGVLYVTAMDAPAGALPTWKIWALDVATGDVRPGWPVKFAKADVEAKNTNRPAAFDEDARYVSQRSALALSPDGERVYVSFGGYWDEAVGWIVAVDTRAPEIAASFAGAADTLEQGGVFARHANAGMWGPGGPAIDERGRVWVTTGNSPEAQSRANAPHVWGNSMLRLTRDLVLDAAYTPFDACALDARDVDIAGSSVVLLPGAGDTAPSLAAFGGKSGTVYLLDGDAFGPAAAGRPPCATSFRDAARDASLLPPAPAEPYCAGFGADPCAAPTPSSDCVRGPLQVFGPPGDDASVDRAKMRTTPAYFRSADGTASLFVAGSTKAARCVPDTMPPSVVRLRVAGDGAHAAWLEKDAADTELAFMNPGSPVVTSHEGRDPVVWVLDQNARRTQALLDPTTPGPILYAVDGTTMKVLYRSGALFEPGGKYATPATAHGTVFVATDRLRALVPSDAR